MDLSKEQQSFVDALDHDVLVSASAGSGKTTTMIEKLTYLILDKKVPVDNLLVVTYTEAAASEMKQKLYLKLQEKIKERNYSSSELDYYYEQLFGIATADIGTLHSVCKRLVSKYFYEVNVEPSFSILNQEESANLFNLALDKVIEQYIVSEDMSFYNLYESVNDKRNSQKLKDIITKIYYYLTEKSDPQQYIDFCLKDCLNDDIYTNICAKYIIDYYHKYVVDIVNKLAGYKKIVVSEKINDFIDTFIAQISPLVDTRSIVEFNLHLENIEYPRRSKPKEIEDLDAYDSIGKIVDAFKTTINTNFKKKYSSVTSESFKTHTAGLKQFYEKLMEVTLKVSDEFKQLKLDVGKLDFADLQKYAYLILDNHVIQSELREHYKYIFVDEYQDINQIQEDILLRLSSGDNLNMIGDVKQSIYAFRQCMPEIFLSKYNKYLSQKSNNLILLNTNYRCGKAIVDFVNMCFDKTITNDTVGIDYEKDARLVCGSNNSGKVELRLINVNKKKNITSNNTTPNDNEDNEDQSQELEKDRAEAVVVAGIIKDVYGTDYYDGYNKVTRQLDYKDIAILVRDAKGYLTTLYKVLKDHNIPVSTTIKQQLFNTIEINLLYSVIKLLGNSDSDVDICNVLTSPIINLTYEQLSIIRTETNCYSFYDCINEYMVSGKNSIVVAKLKEYNAFLNELRYNLKFNSIYQTMLDMVIKYQLFDYYLSLPNGQERVGNIDLFLHLLNNDGFKYNVSKCLEFLDSVSNKDDFLINVESGENAVKILTMHKSKGLEYPCVILSNLGKSFNTNSARDNVVLTNEYGLGIHYRDSDTHTEYLSLQKQANVMFKIHQEQEEQIRLLYVSLTRAKNMLYMTGCYNFDNISKLCSQPVIESKCFLDLIFKGFDSNAFNGLNNRLAVFDVNINKDSVAKVTIANIADIADTITVEHNDVIINGEDKSVVNKLSDNFKRVVPEVKDKLATKTSVTGLMKEDDYTYDSELNLKVTFNEKDNLSLKIGNAYHKIMQSLNYNENIQQINDIISRLHAVSDIDDETMKYIDVEKIYRAKQNVSKLISDSTRILKEQQFLYKTRYSDIVEESDNPQDVLIQGVVDLILINGKEAILIDFKTNRTKDVAKLINAYSLQLEVYKQAVSSGLKVKVVSTKLYLFESNSFIEIV